MQNPITNKDLKRRIIEISYKHKLSHIGSCLTAVDIIKEIYDTKKPDEKFVLSAGHAHLAHLVVQDSYTPKGGAPSPEQLIEKYGIHCDRQAGCDFSTGSLGHGIGAAVGMALADRSKNVYCLISDGECSEGSIWETLRIAQEQRLDNLFVEANINGWGAYKQITIEDHLLERLMEFGVRCNFTDVEQLPFLKGQDAHYHVMTEEEYNQSLKTLT